MEECVVHGGGHGDDLRLEPDLRGCVDGAANDLGESLDERRIREDRDPLERYDLEKDRKVLSGGEGHIIQVVYSASPLSVRQPLHRSIDDDGRHHRLRQIGAVRDQVRADGSQRDDNVDFGVGEKRVDRGLDAGQRPVRLDLLGAREVRLEVAR